MDICIQSVYYTLNKQGVINMSMIIDDNMKVILQDWANRGRLHRGPIVVNQLFQRLKVDYGYTAERKAFEGCLLLLEENRYIRITRGNKGALLSFQTIQGDIISVAKSLGFQSVVARRVITPKRAHVTNLTGPVVIDAPARESLPIESRVVVLFTVKGLRCKAEIPEQAIFEFEKMIKP